jgi:hypothetical protein
VLDLLDCRTQGGLGDVLAAVADLRAQVVALGGKG